MQNVGRLSKQLFLAVCIGVYIFSSQLTLADPSFMKGIDQMSIAVEIDENHINRTDCGYTSYSVERSMKVILGDKFSFQPGSGCIFSANPYISRDESDTICYGFVEAKLDCQVTGFTLQNPENLGSGWITIWNKSQILVFSDYRKVGVVDSTVRELVEEFVIDWRQAQR